MKKLFYIEDIYEAEYIVKTQNSIIGYTDNVVVFEFSGISDFGNFILEEGQGFDLPEPTELERIEQLENMILMMMEVM